MSKFEEELKKSKAVDTLLDVDTEKEEVAPVATQTGEGDVADQFMNRFEEKIQKPRIEDTHKRATFLVRNDLLERLDARAKYLEKLAMKKNKRGTRGLKSDLVNKALENLLDSLDKKYEQ